MLTKPFNYVYQSGRRVNDEYEIKILPNEHVRKIESKFLHDYSVGFIGLMCPRCFNYDIIKIRNQFARYDTQSSLIYKTPVNTIVDVKYKLSIRYNLPNRVLGNLMSSKDAFNFKLQVIICNLRKQKKLDVPTAMLYLKSQLGQ